MKRTTTLLLALMLVLAALAGCGGSSNPQQSADPAAPVEYRDTLVVGSAKDPILNPWEALDLGDMIVCRQVYDTLFYLGPDGKLIPGLAEDFEWLDDTHIKFNLRQGVKFHDGTEFTAEDVKYWYDNLVNYPRQAARNQAFDDKGHEILDPYTVVIQLKFPFAGAVDQVPRHSMGPKHLIEQMGVEQFSAKPVGTGPYKMDEFIPGTQASMSRFDGYWQGPAQTEKIVVKIIPEESSRNIEIETGGVDMLPNVSTRNFKHFDSVPGVKIEYDAAYQFTRIMYSYDEPLFDNKDLRYALSHAVDVNAIITSVYDGYWTPMNTMWASLVPGSTPHEPIKYDLALAKEYMAKAGYPNGGLKFRLHAVNPPEKKIGEILQSMWKEIGVEVEIFHNPLATYQATYKHQIAVNIGSAPFLANTISTYMWKGQTALMPPATGRMGELENLAQGETDEAKRQVYLDELQDILWDDLRVMPLATGVMGYALSDKIEGFAFDPYGAPYLHTYKIRK